MKKYTKQETITLLKNIVVDEEEAESIEFTRAIDNMFPIWDGEDATADFADVCASLRVQFQNMLRRRTTPDVTQSTSGTIRRIRRSYAGEQPTGAFDSPRPLDLPADSIPEYFSLSTISQAMSPVPPPDSFWAETSSPNIE